MSSDNAVEIVYITDSNYVLPTLVSITSLIDNCDDSVKYNINILGDGLDDREIYEINTLNGKKDNVSIKFQDINNDLKYLYKGHQHVSGTALVKFNLANIFSYLDKILYIDGDTLILGDINELFSVDVSDYCVAAVKDMIVTIEEKWDKILGLDNYFNSGVMLLNLDRWRCEDVRNRLVEEKLKDEINHFVDQNALNIILAKKVLFLDLKYNLMKVHILRYSKSKIADYYNISEKEVEKQITEPLVLHLANSKKPWKYIDDDNTDLWISYLIECADDYLIMKCMKYYLQTLRGQIKNLEENNIHINNEISSLRIRVQQLNNDIQYYKNRTLWGVLSYIKKKIVGSKVL